jgi:hypothetical protein
MSQNRPLPDMAGVARGLADPDDPHHNPAAAARVAERLAQATGPQMDLGREATSRAAKTSNLRV